MTIYELEKEQRDALIFWMNDLCGNDPIIISDPHGYFDGKGVEICDKHLYKTIEQSTQPRT